MREENEVTLTNRLNQLHVELEQYIKNLEQANLDLSRLKSTDHVKRKELEDAIASYTYTKIPETQMEISNVQERLSAIRAKGRKAPDTESDDKDMKKAQIDRIKKKYKSGPKFKRFLLFVSGKTPRFGKLKEMDLDSLRYIERVAEGDTKITRSAIEGIEQSVQDEKMTFAEGEKRKKDYKWSKFVSSLQKLDQTEELAKSEGKGFNI